MHSTLHPSPPRWWPLLLLGAYTLHLAEEVWGGEGFEVWMERAFGMPISTTRFLVLNGIAWPLFAALTVAAIRKPAWAWFPTTLGTILAVNGALHALGTVATGTYSPGVVTGLFLYLPLGSFSLLQGRRHLAPRAFAASVVGGIAVHAAVALIAFA